VYVETFGTHTVDPDVISAALVEVFDLRPMAIINDLDLLNRNYLQTSTYGHFGRDAENFTWENTDRVDALKAAVARLTGV
jgi:S-adenosylmethionine synthetase